MTNGVRLFDVEWLKATNNQGYGPLPMPIQRDEQISSIIRQWTLLDAEHRREASAFITESCRPTLLAYSERMASLAVRKKQQELIFTGLLALGLDGWRTDWRENVLLLCLHLDAARKIGAVPTLLFGEAATLLPSNVGASFVAFVNRKPEDQTLAAMGYKESADIDGFRYERSW